MPRLAYPYGYSNARVREMAPAVGYDFGNAVRNTMTSTGTDLFRLPRLTVHNSTRMSEFRHLAEGRLAPTMLRDRALTTCWSVVRRSRAALARGRVRLGYMGGQC